jgi:hypothetical protein
MADDKGSSMESNGPRVAWSSSFRDNADLLQAFATRPGDTHTLSQQLAITPGNTSPNAQAFDHRMTEVIFHAGPLGLTLGASSDSNPPLIYVNDLYGDSSNSVLRRGEAVREGDVLVAVAAQDGTWCRCDGRHLDAALEFIRQSPRPLTLRFWRAPTPKALATVLADPAAATHLKNFVIANSIARTRVCRPFTDAVATVGNAAPAIQEGGNNDADPHQNQSFDYYDDATSDGEGQSATDTEGDDEDTEVSCSKLGSSSVGAPRASAAQAATLAAAAGSRAKQRLSNATRRLVQRRSTSSASNQTRMQQPRDQELQPMSRTQTLAKPATASNSSNSSSNSESVDGRGFVDALLFFLHSAHKLRVDAAVTSSDKHQMRVAALFRQVFDPTKHLSRIRPAIDPSTAAAYANVSPDLRARAVVALQHVEEFVNSTLSNQSLASPEAAQHYLQPPPALELASVWALAELATTLLGDVYRVFLRSSHARAMLEADEDDAVSASNNFPRSIVQHRDSLAWASTSFVSFATVFANETWSNRLMVYLVKRRAHVPLCVLRELQDMLGFVSPHGSPNAVELDRRSGSRTEVAIVARFASSVQRWTRVLRISAMDAVSSGTCHHSRDSNGNTCHSTSQLAGHLCASREGACEPAEESRLSAPVWFPSCVLELLVSTAQANSGDELVEAMLTSLAAFAAQAQETSLLGAAPSLQRRNQQVEDGDGVITAQVRTTSTTKGNGNVSDLSIQQRICHVLTTATDAVRLAVSAHLLRSGLLQGFLRDDTGGHAVSAEYASAIQHHSTASAQLVDYSSLVTNHTTDTIRDDESVQLLKQQGAASDRAMALANVHALQDSMPQGIVSHRAFQLSSGLDTDSLLALVLGGNTDETVAVAVVPYAVHFVAHVDGGAGSPDGSSADCPRMRAFQSRTSCSKVSSDGSNNLPVGFWDAILLFAAPPMPDADSAQSPSTTDPILFNFVVPRDGRRLYGAALVKYGLNGDDLTGVTADTPAAEGVAIVSEFPLFHSLRAYLLAHVLTSSTGIGDVGETDSALARLWSPSECDLDAIVCAEGQTDFFRAHLRSLNDFDVIGELASPNGDQIHKPDWQLALLAATQDTVLGKMVGPALCCDLSLSYLFETLDVRSVLVLLECVLLERKILLVSKHITLLVFVCEALCVIIAPLQWNHVLVPVLPRKLLGNLMCPTPYLIGIHESYAFKHDFPFVVDSVVVNLDANVVTMPQFTDE